MSDCAYQKQAETGAILETSFDTIAEMGQGGPADLSDLPGLDGYTVVDVGTFDRGPELGGGCYKAITVVDAEGNIYVHYRGTGDGNWGLNAPAYGPEASSVQKWAEDYCNRTLDNNYTLNTDYPGRYPDAKIYLSGHSQGGNNAQYAMLTTKYADEIEACISLDGQTFSHDVLNDLRSVDGYSQRRDKIYAYYGAYDFVSPLGQEQPVPGDHVYMVELAEGYTMNGKDPGIPGFHMVEYMLDENGHFVNPKRYDSPDNGESAFRKTIRDLNALINKLPPEMQERVAKDAMMVAEYFMGDDRGGNIKGDFSFLQLNELLIVVVPALITTMITHPEDFIGILTEAGVFEKITQFAKEHPFLTVALVLCAPFLVKVLAGLGVLALKIALLVDFICVALELAWKGLQALADFCQKAFEVIKNAVQAICEWGRNTFNRGVKYVQNNPSFRGDPSVLRTLAGRISSVNSRLRSLDGMMNDLYWQVGFLDLWDILCSNLLTSGSPTLLQVQNYLNNTATRIENAESQAAGIIGG